MHPFFPASANLPLAFSHTLSRLLLSVSDAVYCNFFISFFTLPILTVWHNNSKLKFIMSLMQQIPQIRYDFCLMLFPVLHLSVIFVKYVSRIFNEIKTRAVEKQVTITNSWYELHFNLLTALLLATYDICRL